MYIFHFYFKSTVWTKESQLGPKHINEVLRRMSGGGAHKIQNQNLCVKMTIYTQQVYDKSALINMKEGWENREGGEFRECSLVMEGIKSKHSQSYMAHGETRRNAALSVLCSQEVTHNTTNEWQR